MTIQVAKQSDAIGAPREAKGMAPAREQILCIENDRETAALLADQLSSRGFAVRVVHDGLDGLFSILKDKPDLILCDFGVPLISCLEILDRLQEIACSLGRIPFVVLSASTDRADEIKTRQLGADDYVTKPIDFDRLALIIDARLAGIARARLPAKRRPTLNPREIEVLTFVARGKTSAQIARKLRLSKRTVDFHIDNARSKVGGATRTEAVIKAAAHGLIAG
jgi:DNA-binding NarL/FixJ family response regulator